MSEEILKACETCKYQLFSEWDEPCASCQTPTLDSSPTHWVDKSVLDDEDVSLKPEDIHQVESCDSVNHPSHYNREGAMECIDEMVLIFGKLQTANFCKLNAWKYRYRAALKSKPEEDYRKSDWYIKKYAELMEGNL